jgi:N utilization substance protein B
MSDDNLSNDKVDPRRLARLLAIQFLFTKLKAERSSEDYSYFEPNTLLHEIEAKKFDNRLYEDIIEGVEKSEKEIDELIVTNAPEWPLDQLNPVDLLILRVAIWESKIEEKNPFKVAINEAIEISKVISSDKSAKFINGVLGSILK